MENEKELRVIRAAKTVFLRYGFRRVTMQDVAAEAGISRPALYLIYPNKEEIFKAAARQIASESMAIIRDGLHRFPGMEGKLNFAFDVWTVRPFELMLNSPDAKDVIECTHGFAKEAISKTGAEFETLLLEILAPLKARSNKPVIPLPQVAHLLATSVHGYKESAADVADLRAMIAGLLKLTLAALQPKPTKAS
jgi:AcrR family transcriptional regulator